MNVVLAATFRDSVDYLDRYLAQASCLQDVMNERGDGLRFLWGENDSEDGTPKLLREVTWPNVTVVDVSTGARYYRSYEDHQLRWENVARYSNATLDHLTEEDDALLWVESDLLWGPEVLAELVDLAMERGVAGAPVWHQRGFFYDSWSCRKAGHPFNPEHPEWEGIVHVDSCAGALAIRGDLARKHRFMPDDAVRAWCRSMGGVWLNTDLKVIQP